MSSASTLNHRMALRALTNGKAPPVLHEELFVGRGTELALFSRDLDLAEAGGASIRILVGEPGSGKTMLLQAMAACARARRFVTTSVDLSPDRLLHGRGGEGRALLRETLLGMHTAATGDKLAVDAIVSRFGNDCQAEASAANGPPRSYMRSKLAELHARSKGADFAKIIETFAMAPDSSSMAANCRRWLCGDYSSVTEARDELGIGGIIEDQDFWLMQNHWASFLRETGRPGLALFIDEAQVLCELHNPNARMLNFEQLLVIFNEVLQGRVQGISVVIAAPPEFVTQWNGMAKHKGLNSCLSLKDQSQLHALADDVILQLGDLSEVDLVSLLQRCRGLLETCRPGERALPDEWIDGFLQTCRNQIGEAHWQIPRRIIQRLFDLHAKAQAYPGLEWSELIYPNSADTEGAHRMFDGYAQRQM